MKTLYASFNYFHEISLTRNDAEKCSHPGPCDSDVDEVLAKPYVQKQLKAIDPEKIKKELSEYGAWDEEELSDIKSNQQRIIWIAAGNITEELYYKRKN